MGDLVGADADSQHALMMAPANASFHARRGAILQQQKSLSAALAEYDRALTLNPRLFWVYILRGNARYHSGDWRGLSADYTKAFALQTERSAAMVMRTLLPGLESDPVEAERSCEEHLRQDPKDPVSYARRGLLLLLLQREADAEADFEQCRLLYPEATPHLEQLIRQIRRVGQIFRERPTTVQSPGS
jgi:tetratricopeptide (TPR) repeat protein